MAPVSLFVVKLSVQVQVKAYPWGNITVQETADLWARIRIRYCITVKSFGEDAKCLCCRILFHILYLNYLCVLLFILIYAVI